MMGWGATRKIGALLSLPLILAVQGLLAVAVLHGSGTLERILSQFYRMYFNGTLTVERFHLGLFSGPRFDGVRITPPGEKEPLIHVRSVVFEHVDGDVLEGEYTPRSITLEEPVLVLRQYRDGSFSFEKLIDPERFEALTGASNGAGGQNRLSRLFLTGGWVRLEGEGPIPAAVRSHLAPGKAVTLQIANAYCMRGPSREKEWAFGGLLIHEALGEIQVEGYLDGEGLRILEVELAGFDPKSHSFKRYLSDALQKGLAEAGPGGTVQGSLLFVRREDGGYSRKGRIRGASLEPKAVPLIVKDLELDLSLAEEGLRIEDLHGLLFDGTIEGEARLGGSDPLTCEFTISGDRIPFCPEVEAALEALGGGRDYRAFAPEGEGRFTFNGRWSETRKRVEGDLFIWPGGASASYVGYIDPVTGEPDTFPYRVYDLQGEIEVILGEKVVIRNLEGYTRPLTRRSGHEADLSRGRVLIDGYVSIDDSDASKDLTILGRDIPFNETLTHGLRQNDSDTLQIIEQFHPEGRFDFGTRIRHGNGGVPDLRTVADLKDVRLNYDGFPYPLEKVRGRIIRENGQVVLEQITAYRASDPATQAGGAPANPGDAGRNWGHLLGEEEVTSQRESGELILDGLVESGRVVRLTAFGVRQHVTDKLKASLRKVVPEETHDLLDTDFDGTLDFVFRLPEEREGDDFTLDLSLQMDRVSGRTVPVPLENVTGSIHLDYGLGELEGHNLSLEAGGGKLRFSGLKVLFAENPVSLAAEGSVHHLEMATDISRMLGASAAEFWAGLGCTGGMDVDAFSVKTEILKDGTIGPFEAKASLRFNDGCINDPVTFSKIHGNLDLNIIREQGEKGGVVLKGQTERITFETKDRLFTDVETAFEVKDGVLTCRRFNGYFYGGRIQGSGEPPLLIDFKPPGPFRGSFELEGAALQYFVDRSHYAFRRLGGRVSGKMNFQGELDNPHRTVVDGEIAVVEGSLFELPAFGELSRLMGSVFSTEPPTFTGGSASFVLEQGILNLVEIKLDSNLMRLTGSGKMTVDGMDIKFIPSTSVMPYIPLLGNIVNLIKDVSLTFKISGPYSNLKVTYESIMDRLFSSDEISYDLRFPGAILFEFPERF